MPFFHVLVSLPIWLKHVALHSQACVFKTPKRPLFSKKFRVVGAAFRQSASVESFFLQTRLCWPQFYKSSSFFTGPHLEIQRKALRNNTWGILLIWVDSSCLGEVDLLSMTLSLEISMSRKLIQPQRSNLKAQYIADLSKKNFWVFCIYLVLLNSPFILHFLIV